jgi:hypothetical protein
VMTHSWAHFPFIVGSTRGRTSGETHIVSGLVQAWSVCHR